MKKNKFQKPEVEIIDLLDDIISTSGSYIDPGTTGGGEIPEVDPWSV